MKYILIIVLSIAVDRAFAQDEGALDREPAGLGPAVVVPQRVKAFPGGTDEEDLRVQSTYAESPITTDARSVQREIYKDIYKKELADDRAAPDEEADH